MESKWAQIRHEKTGVKAAWITGLTVVVVSLLIGGTWFMRGLAIPLLVAVLLIGFFLRGTELNARETLVYRIVVFVIAFLAIGPWITPQYGVRLGLFVAFGWFWFKRPIGGPL